MRVLRSAEVWLSGQRVGVLERNQQGLTRWIPDTGWEQGGQRPRLGLAFLRSPGPKQSGTGLPSWFENLLPDVGSALRGRLAAVHGLRVQDSLGLLSVLGSDLPGAVEFRPRDLPSGPPSMVGSPLVDRVVVHPATDQQGRAEADALATVSKLRFSLAGMQLKLSMSAREDRFVLTSRSDDRYWIVKLPGAEYPGLAEVEAATMAWAKAAGHDVPKNFAFPVDRIEGLPEGFAATSPTAFAIERFDRRIGGIRLHHEDFCQALELLPDHKYGDSGPEHWSLDGALRLVADAAGEAQAIRFAQRVGFVIATGNGDAHLKNWSFAWGSADRPVLSPCYDFVSTITWSEQLGWKRRHGPELGLGLGRVRHFVKLDDDALRRHADKSGQPWARDAIMDGIEKARRAWPQVEALAPRTMRSAIRTHWRKVPVLIAAGTLPWTPPPEEGRSGSS